jgi:hypothetical protein
MLRRSVELSPANGGHEWEKVCFIGNCSGAFKFLQFVIEVYKAEGIQARRKPYIQKKAICKYKVDHNTTSYAIIAQWAKKEFNLLYEPSESTISRTLSKQETFLTLVPQDHNIKRARVVVHPQLEAALITWVRTPTTAWFWGIPKDSNNGLPWSSFPVDMLHDQIMDWF